MDLKNFFQPNNFKKIATVLGVIIALLVVFKVGELVGYKKAEFSYRWGDNYYRNFAGPRSGLNRMMDFRDQNFMAGHGVFGTIIKIESATSTPTIVIKDQNNDEKIILIAKDAVIRSFRDTITTKDLKVNDRVVIIGSPNDAGQIEAKLIRVIPLNSTL